MENMITRENIKKEFLDEAASHGKAVVIGDHKTANKIHKKLMLLYNKAKENNELSVFSEVMDDSNENIKLWAATFTLRYSPIAAETTLQKLTDLPTITGSTAKTTLHLWKEGMLNLL